MTATTLTLMRHAKSSWHNQGQADHDRPLNKRGQRDAPLMASRLMQRGTAPSIILSSTAQRTRETTEHLLEVFGQPTPDVEYSDSLYLASPEALLNSICKLPDDTRHVMLIAHNPGIEELSAFLAGVTFDTMPTAAVRQFSCNSLGDLRALMNGDASQQAGNAPDIKLTYSDYPKNTDT